MKHILFCLLTLLSGLQLSGQKVVKDSITIRNDSVFTLKYQAIYDHVPDTFGLSERYLQIESIISAFRTEQEMIKTKIAFFESNKPLGFIESPEKVTLPVQPATKKQPARKPKKKKQ